MATSLVDLDYEFFKIPDYQNINSQISRRIIPMTMNRSTNNIKTNMGGWQSHSFTYDEDPMNPSYDMNIVVKPIMRKVYSEFDALLLNMDSRSYYNGNYTSYYWFNINYEGDYNVDHKHVPNSAEKIPVLLSGCYYLDVPEDSGCFVFRGNKEHLKPFFTDCIDTTLMPESGDCMIFCPSKQHYVETSKSKGLRFSMAFDIIPK